VVPDVRERPAGAGGVERGLEGDLVAERLHRGVRPAVGELEDLLGHVARRRVDHDVGPEAPGHLLPVGQALDRDDQARAAQLRAERRRQAHRALGEDRHRAADRDVGVLGADDARGEHVAGVDRRLVGEPLGDRREVVVGVVDVEVLGHVAVLLDGEAVAAERAAALRGVAGLAVVAGPVGGHGVDRDPVPDLHRRHAGAELVHHADALVPEQAPLRHGQEPRDGVDVGGADQRRGRPHDRLAGTGAGDLALDETHLARPEEREGLHGVAHRHDLLAPRGCTDGTLSRAEAVRLGRSAESIGRPCSRHALADASSQFSGPDPDHRRRRIRGGPAVDDRAASGA
jgi:hypothetical protein